MSENFFKRLEKCFSAVKFLFSAPILNEVRLAEALKEMRYIKNQLGQDLPARERALISYAIDTLIELVREGDDAKICDFATTVCKMPRILLGELRIEDFDSAIDDFRKKYGEEYFQNMEKSTKRRLGLRAWTVIILLTVAIVIGVITALRMSDIISAEGLRFYGVSLLMLALPSVLYIWHRNGIDYWLRRKRLIPRSEISKLKRGCFSNRWLYRAIHNEYGMGPLYYLNKCFVLLDLFTIAFTILFGLVKPMSFIVSGLCILTYILTAVMTVFADIQNNLEEHGTPVVLFAKNQRCGIDSIFLDIGIIVFILMLGYGQMLITADLWGVDLRIF